MRLMKKNIYKVQRERDKRMQTLKIVIAGSRDIRDYARLTSFIAEVLPTYPGYTRFLIITGGARGVDLMGKRYARDNAHLYKEFKPIYDGKNNRFAPLARNEDMAKIGDIVIALWDGSSKGTLHMINAMKKKGKATHVYNCATGEREHSHCRTKTVVSC